MDNFFNFMIKISFLCLICFFCLINFLFRKYKENDKTIKIRNKIDENFKYLRDFEEECFCKTIYGKDTFNIDKWEKGLASFFREEFGGEKFDYMMVSKIFDETKKYYETIEKLKEPHVVYEMVKHYQTLNIKFNRSNIVDDYGVDCFNYTKFDEDLAYFAENVLKDETLSKTFLFHCFVEAGKTAKINNIDDFDLSQVKTGEDYENFVRALCVDCDFECAMTPKTGDQGGDLIVSKGQSRIAIQCKYYSSSIGNAAVQEVVAGKEFYNCNYACVVSNQDYTNHAKTLARSTGVELLSHETLIPYLQKL